MTTAEFIAACVWPSVLVCAFALLKARNTAAFPYVGKIVFALGLTYIVLLPLYDKSSIIAVNDLHIFMVVMGLMTAGAPLWQLPLYGSWRDKAKALGSTILIAVLGCGVAWYAGRMLFLDHLTPRIVIEGLVERAWRSSGSRKADYLVRIANETVKTTEPLYERLQKGRSRVRVEVGRGSNYVYDIEYLSD
ncbi:hypothetical protein LPJ38_05330 [Bradyrhizobium daqingense]|uniref:Uncharacterized protein n=1 Tax=Bradyrhizobium daqingense TaxID=993502 RepID=A0A562LIL1_9BRAD|nr:hypothetical protein [Bradyrhizobium daqingense]TWI07448.1 hypothetical protein IQ17_01798 [Bradyrhizobium daqingense]UFS90211.1 hypothetical protein LPJ38_05330 [Bradyrhizobium daqingense]